MRWIAILCLAFLSAVSVFADDQAVPASTNAQAALTKFEHADDSASLPHLDTVATARKQYQADLHRVLDSALKSSNAEAATWTKEELARLDTGGLPGTEKPPVAMAMPSWARYDRTVQTGAAEARRKFEISRAACLTELRAAQRAALVTQKDIAEGNRIGADIKRVQDTEFSLGSQNVINLMTLSAPPVAINSTWKITPTMMTSPAKPSARIEFPYVPPAEYDFSATVERITGDDAISLVAVGNGRQFIWAIGSFGNTKAGFAVFDGKGVDKTPTMKQSNAWIVNGRKYTTLVKVRQNRVEGYLNGKLISSLDTDYSTAALASPDRLPHMNTLGMIAWNCQVRITQAQIVEITGKGSALTEP